MTRKLPAIRVDSRFPRIALGALFVIALAAIINPPRAGARRALSDSDRDSVARFNVVATHDFRFEREDAEALEGVRATAAAQVVPIWDHDEAVGEVVLERVRAAFVDARARLAAAGAARAAAAAGSGSPAVADGSDDEPAGTSDGSEPADVRDEDALIRLVPRSERARVVADSGSVRALLEGARVPDDIAIPELSRDGFSRETEDALTNLLREVVGKHVVEDVTALEDIGASGITLRTVRRGQPRSERAIRQLLNFGDLSQLEALMAPARHHLFYIEDARLRDAIGRTAKALVVVNTRLNITETEKRRAEAMDAAEARYRSGATETFREGELLVSRGEVITDDTLAILQRMADTEPKTRSPLQRALGAIVLVVLVVFPLFLFARANLPHFSTRTRDIAMVCVVMVTQLGVARAGIYVTDALVEQSVVPAAALYVLAPLAAGAILVRILTNAETALVYSVTFALLGGVVFRFDVAFTAYALLTAVVGSTAVRSAQSRGDILRACAVVGAVAVGGALSVNVLRAGDVDEATLATAVAAALSGLTNALFVYAFLPILESTFRYTTPMRLMELANLNHPALKELILKAPGSYHHSMMVGQLVEAACEAVGADALLGRVGSYFHDIGKTRNPLYFAENQQGVNPHDKLKPNMSALVIKAHVKDGVELAKQYRLPPEIIEFIREHHGTSLIAYFHRRAQEQSDAEVPETDYRYPGPKPQSRETAICMLADGIEAASRSLADPTHAHLKGLVQKMINRAFIDGQLDECDLTLKDLDAIAQAILLRLTAFYHHRPEYPDARKSQQVKRQRRSEPLAGVAPQEDEADDGDPDPNEREAARPPSETSASDGSGLHLPRLGM
ncbi:MAG: HDIG domain-containing protein [Myxococcales bacterium]|nr:HDIG domain-containing protein [Myxococcales bacterium]MCB9520031.1 HDIG domain-containing protein [Myxococcales bacterium]